MITQKALCLKLDEEVISGLDWECAVQGRKRNRCINEAVAQWTARQERYRQRGTPAMRTRKPTTARLLCSESIYLIT